MFDHFRFAHFRISIAAGKYGLLLPPHKGSTFRGGFGQMFRRVTCALHKNDCTDCRLREQCPYAYIFETAPPGGSEALSNYENVPRPFVIEPPADQKTGYNTGETLAFNLLLIGRAIDYLPYFIVVFREMEEMGIGRGLRPFKLMDVTAVGPDHEESIYSLESNTVRGIDLSYSGKEIIRGLPETARKLFVRFETPFWLKDQGRLAATPDFHIFFRQAMRRVSALSYFHHGIPLQADYPGLAERSRRVKLTANKTWWQDWERYSRRQKQRITLGGLVGEVAYEGDLSEFLPWLAIGESVHVGKNTVFGLGKYKMNL